MECPVGTVMSRLFRGRKLLAAALREFAVAEGYVKQAARRRATRRQDDRPREVPRRSAKAREGSQMSLCESIDTLSMAYLDDELAAEERRELELHLHRCASCRAARRRRARRARADPQGARRAAGARPAARAARARARRRGRRGVARERRRWTQLAAAGLGDGRRGRRARGVRRRRTGRPAGRSARSRSEAMRQRRARCRSRSRARHRPVAAPALRAASSRRSSPNAGSADRRAADRRRRVTTRRSVLEYLVTSAAERLGLTAVVLTDVAQRRAQRRRGDARSAAPVLHVHQRERQAGGDLRRRRHVGYVFMSERADAQRAGRAGGAVDLIAGCMRPVADAIRRRRSTPVEALGPCRV